jgi:riboflavin kinase/FMN adenylyltransferase
MQIYRHLDSFQPPQRPVLTIGTFDGVHTGHQQILNRLRSIAREQNGAVCLMTFYPHPRKVLYPQHSSLSTLNTLEEKEGLLSGFGVEHLLVQPFTRDFSLMSYDRFVKEILVEKLKVHTLVIGYDHQFGYQRKGDMKALEVLAEQYGFQLEEIPEHDVDALAVSSTRIREALNQGRVSSAAQLLGYAYSLSGRVVGGKKIGRTLGFPTANLLPDDPDKLVPALGIYAVRVEWNGALYKGALSIGRRPTFDNGEVSVEVHLLDFDEDLYGERLRLYFEHFIRPELRFTSVEELIEQMHRDVALCHELLAR